MQAEDLALRSMGLGHRLFRDFKQIGSRPHMKSNNLEGRGLGVSRAFAVVRGPQ